jgi:hypothetical protein
MARLSTVWAWFIRVFVPSSLALGGPEARRRAEVALFLSVVWLPAAWWMRAAGPASALALSLILRRNLRALDVVVASA